MNVAGVGRAGAMPLRVIVTAVLLPVWVSMARPVTPELFAGARSAIAMVPAWPAAGAAGAGPAAAPVGRRTGGGLRASRGGRGRGGRRPGVSAPVVPVAGAVVPAAVGTRRSPPRWCLQAVPWSRRSPRRW